MTKVVIVTSVELGWDCVVGVFQIGLLSKVEERFRDYPYNVFVKTLDEDLDDFE